MRAGELIALEWGDVSLSESVIHVQRSRTSNYTTATKNHEARDVHLTPEVVEMLGAWWGESANPDQACLVFRSDSGAYLTPARFCAVYARR